MATETDPSKMNFADAISIVALLAFGDRSKMTKPQIRVYADALSGILHAAADLIGTGEVALVPTLTGLTRCSECSGLLPSPRPRMHVDCDQPSGGIVDASPVAAVPAATREAEKDAPAPTAEAEHVQR